MASTKERTVRVSPNEPQLPASPREPTTTSAIKHFQEYGRERPGVVALWCLGIGFVLGWKLKLW